MPDSSRGFGYWLSIFANLAVVGGIVFLGVQIRQNSQMMRAQTRNDFSAADIGLLTVGIEDSDFADMLRRGDAGEELSEAEQEQYRRRTTAWFRSWENAFYQYRLGLYDESEYSVLRNGIRRTLAAGPGWAEFWCGSKSVFSEEFGAEIDGLLSTYRC